MLALLEAGALNDETPSGWWPEGVSRTLELLSLLLGQVTTSRAHSYSQDDRSVVELVSEQVVNKLFMVLEVPSARGSTP